MSHKKFPYLLKGVKIEGVNHIWSTDITYIPVRTGYLFLVAILDWFSRYVITWRLSNNLESEFCIDALKAALRIGRPKIFNSDQGVQFTNQLFTGRLEQAGVSISMDGRGRALDNVFVERLWWSVKHEHVYRHDHQSVVSLHRGLDTYLEFFNRKRRHQSLTYETPWDVYHGKVMVKGPMARP